MLHWRCAYYDTSRNRKWNVHGLRVGGNCDRTTGGLQPERAPLGPSTAGGGPRLRRKIWQAIGLGEMAPVDNACAGGSRPSGLAGPQLALVMAGDVRPDAIARQRGTPGDPMKPLTECRLYAFVDTAYLRGRAPEEVARQLCLGGADLLQLRAKQSSPEEIRRMASKILPITRASAVGLVINDHVSIAKEVGAEFCHLGQEDFFDAGYSHVSRLSSGNTP